MQPKPSLKPSTPVGPKPTLKKGKAQPAFVKNVAAPKVEPKEKNFEPYNPDLKKNLAQLRSIKPGVVSAIFFKISTPEEIIGVNNCQVSEPSSEAKTNCVSDPMMGAVLLPGTQQDCQKCGQDIKKCPGHFGYIKLEWPIFNPAFISSIVKILRLFCFSHFKTSFNARKTIIAKYLVSNAIESASGTSASNLEAVKRVRESKEQLRARAEAYADSQGVFIEIIPCFDPKKPEQDWPDIHGTWRLQLIESNRRCKKCTANKEEVNYVISRDFYIEEQIGTGDDKKSAVVDPQDVRDFFDAIDKDTNEKGENRNWARVIGFGTNKLSAMITTVLPVLPNTQRPGIRTPNGVLENPLTKVYRDIVSANKQLGNVLRQQRATADFGGLAGSEMRKGISFDAMLSSSYADDKAKGDKANSSNAGKKAYEDLNQRIHDLIYAKDDANEEKFDTERHVGSQVVSVTTTVNGKQGILRRDIMGKGSDHSGRTVIIGDVNMFIDEIGVPIAFAEVLTIPEVLETEEDVAKWTAEMPKLVDGKKVMGNIKKVIRPRHRDEQVFHITENSNFALQVGDTIRRRLMNGDIVVMSRQPVLHKGGLMGFKAKIFEDGGNVFRIHPAVVGPFNADYDGDEMNLSVPQSLKARQSVAAKMMVNNCIRGDKYSTPWIGLIQNPVLAGVEISRPGVVVEKDLRLRIIETGLSFFKKRNPGGIFRTNVDEYFDQLYTLENNLDPSSGRALVSFFLPKEFSYERRKGGEEPIIVEKGFMVSGILAKADIGKASNGMVDAILNRYGAEAVVVFLSALTAGLYEFISASGYSLGIRDCTLQRLVDNTDPQDTIDELVKETADRVIEKLQVGSQTGYLAKQAEAEADKLLAALGDRINAIVKAGGVDTVGLKAKLASEKKDTALHEILTHAMTLDIQIDVEKEPFLNLADLKVIDNTLASVHKQIEVVKNIMLNGKRPKNERLSLLQEIDTLTIVINMYSKLEQKSLHKVFKTVQLAMLKDVDISRQVISKLKEAVKIRNSLVGATQFSNRLLTVVYSGAKGTTSNVLQALGSVGPQEKSFIGRDETMDRSLPFFKEGELNPLATHFCASSFAKGMSAEEYWNHASATRANITESNLKPAVTGFFYRRAWVLAGDSYAEEDGSVRDERGRIIQFMYGGDGFDPTRLINVTGRLPPQFISAASEAKNIRTKAGLVEYEYQE